MKYRNHTIEPQHLPGADFRIDKFGAVHGKRPTKADVDFYIIRDPDGLRLLNESTVSRAKAYIDSRCALDTVEA